MISKRKKDNETIGVHQSDRVVSSGINDEIQKSSLRFLEFILCLTLFLVALVPSVLSVRLIWLNRTDLFLKGGSGKGNVCSLLDEYDYRVLS